MNKKFREVNTIDENKSSIVAVAFVQNSNDIDKKYKSRQRVLN